MNQTNCRKHVPFNVSKIILESPPYVSHISCLKDKIPLGDV